jgi:hypothetical protein
MHTETLFSTNHTLIVKYGTNWLEAHDQPQEQLVTWPPFFSVYHPSYYINTVMFTHICGCVCDNKFSVPSMVFMGLSISIEIYVRKF